MPSHQEFGDAEAKRIIARAAELDAQRKPLNANDLREIALEAGISPSAVDRALEEHLQAAAVDQQVPVRRTFRQRVLRHAGWVIAAIILAAYVILRRAVP